MRTKERPEPMPYTEANHLLNPLRNLLLSPRKMVKRLGLRPDDTVLELGPGPGFYSPAVARSIPKGTLVLADVQQEMLDIARGRLEKAGIKNVEYEKADATSLPAEDETFDVVFLASVLGEVPDRDACLGEIRRVLKTGGLLSITEMKLGDPDYISVSEMLTLLRAGGFEVRGQYSRFFTYTVNSTKIS
ncbi:MAG: methyltransferase domain-containing protein [Deltaproteobacteria bacterium]|nr:methyltransferase domain-containing protein [Candidatus Zymogenaceae bacterium]